MNRGARVRMSFVGLAAALIISGGIVMAHASMVGAPAGADAIKPFHVHFSDETLADLKRRVAATRWPDKETGPGPVARRAAGDDAEARALLGDGLRLAQGRGEAERPAAVHDRDRRARHPLHPRALEACRTRCR